jgi:hypothetical protein
MHRKVFKNNESSFRNSPLEIMSDSLLTTAEQRRPAAPVWRSVDQLADMWGMDPERARRVVGALLSTGRMEERDREEVQDSLYRLVC